MIKRSNWVQMISLFGTRERPRCSLKTTKRDVLYMRLACNYLYDLNAYSPFIPKIWRSRSLPAEILKIIERGRQDFFYSQSQKNKTKWNEQQLNLISENLRFTN